MNRPKNVRKRVGGGSNVGHTRVRNPRTLTRLLNISAKLKHGEPLDTQEGILAGELLHMIARNLDPRPLFREPVTGTPRSLDQHYIALHFSLLRDINGSTESAHEVAEAWGYEDEKSVLRIARERRKQCDDALLEANERTRSQMLQEIRKLAEVARSR